MTTLNLYVELVKSPKWPYIATGRTWVRKPKNVSSPVIQINLDVPKTLFELLAQVNITVPEPDRTVSGEAAWVAP